MSSQADTMCISVGECVCVGVGVGVSSSHSGGGRRTRERRRNRKDVEKTCSRCYWKGEDVDWHGSDTRLFTIQRACSRVTCVDLCGWEKKKKRKTALWVACRLLHPVVRVRGHTVSFWLGWRRLGARMPFIHCVQRRESTRKKTVLLNSKRESELLKRASKQWR